VPATLERLVAAHPGLGEALGADRVLLEALVAVSVASRSLFAGLERDPGAIEMLRGDVVRAPIALDDAPTLVTSDDAPRALRVWKRRHIARIAARDLLGIGDLRNIASELALLADACLEVALAIARSSGPDEHHRHGQAGAAELNYASDVDVLFVHEGDGATPTPNAPRASCAPWASRAPRASSFALTPRAARRTPAR
jgi:glutamate-ammonia-ligase adenylyltransferase